MVSMVLSLTGLEATAQRSSSAIRCALRGVGAREQDQDSSPPTGRRGRTRAAACGSGRRRRRARRRRRRGQGVVDALEPIEVTEHDADRLAGDLRLLIELATRFVSALRLSIPVSGSITASPRCSMSERIRAVERIPTATITASGRARAAGFEHRAGVGAKATASRARARWPTPEITPRIENRALSVTTGIASQERARVGTAVRPRRRRSPPRTATQAAKRTYSGRRCAQAARRRRGRTPAAPARGTSVHQPSQGAPRPARRRGCPSASLRTGLSPPPYRGAARGRSRLGTARHPPCMRNRPLRRTTHRR